MSESEKIIEIMCAEHIYPDKTKIELCGKEFSVNYGENIALLGANGSGKTTLIKHVLGLLTPSKGEVKVFGKNPSKDFDDIRSKIGVVLQNVEEQLVGPTVLEDVMFTPLNIGFSHQEAKEAAEQTLKMFDIWDLKDKIIHYLSGGEKRKVALAGALVHNPKLLVLDEPFANIDLKTQKDYATCLKKICEDKDITLIFSSHNIEIAAYLADYIYMISKTKITKKITPLEAFYTNNQISEYNLEEPSIIKLFKILQENGKNIGNPTNINEAFDMLLNYIV